MKKADLLLLISIAVYSFLFYQQSAGLNFFLFSIILTGLLLFKDPSLWKSKSWAAAAAATIGSGLMVMFHSSMLSILTNLFSISLLSAFSLSRGNSVIVSILFSIYTLLTSLLQIILDYLKRKETTKKSESQHQRSKLITIGVPVLATLIFFLLYRASNPVFEAFTNQLNLEFLSFNWMIFTLGGTILMYSFFNYRKVALLGDFDQNTPTILSDAFTFSEKDRQQNYSGVLMLSLLNGLLFFVNALDARYLVSGQIPEGMTYSEFVHQGVTALIASIIIAIGILLYYFRGSLNFFAENKNLKRLAVLWVIQNILLLLSTAYRNTLYINEFTLTYKRIGVYVYLTLALIGLVTTLIKVLEKRSNYYLVRINSALFFVVLVVSSFVQWDKLICNFNVSHAKPNKQLDIHYLATLSDVALPYVYQAKHDQLKERTDLYPITTADRNLYSFLNKMKELEWQSWNISDKETYDKLIKLNSESKIEELHFAYFDMILLDPLAPVSNLKRLKITHSQFDNLSGLKNFQQLDSLVLISNQISHSLEFPHLPKLKTLDISFNKLSILGGITSNTSLTKLDVSGNQISNLIGLEKLSVLEHLDISNNTKLLSIAPILKLKNLKVLEMDSRFASKIDQIKEAIPGIKIELNNTAN